MKHNYHLTEDEIRNLANKRLCVVILPVGCSDFAVNLRVTSTNALVKVIRVVDGKDRALRVLNNIASIVKSYKAMKRRTKDSDKTNDLVDSQANYKNNDANTKYKYNLTSADIADLAQGNACVEVGSKSDGLYPVEFYKPSDDSRCKVVARVPTLEATMRVKSYIKEVVSNHKETPTAATGDQVNSPAHYQVFKDIEAIDIIQLVLGSPLAANLSPYEAYCLGNVLKYRLRAGSKDKLEQDIAKANKYKELVRL